MKVFAMKEEVAAVLAELRDFRSEFEEFRGEVGQFRNEFEELRDGVGEFRNEFEEFRGEVGQFRNEFEELRDGVGEFRNEFEEFRGEVGQFRNEFEELRDGVGEFRNEFEEFRGEVGQFRNEFEEFRDDVGERFERVEQRLDKVEQQAQDFRTEVKGQFASLEERMEAGFYKLHQTIDRLGGRWGIRNESIFRQTIAELLEESFGFHVEERVIQGEQFDCVIFNGQHILVEISASVGPDIQERLERKRRLYTEATGVVPARVNLVAASIHIRRAQALREAGFEVIEPEEDKLW
jgi:hypothetical protein